MGALALFLLILGLAGRTSDASFCLCKKGSDDALQVVLDYACQNGADCGPIQPTGSCFNPDTVRDHCSYAVNSYYVSKAAQGATCDFRGAAYLSNTDPSSNGCSYTAASGSSTPGSVTTPSTPGSSSTTPGSSSTTPGSSSTTPTGTSTGSPYGTSPGSSYTGGTGGSILGTGMAPSGTDYNNMNSAPVRPYCSTSSIFPVLLAAALSFWGYH